MIPPARLHIAITFLIGGLVAGVAIAQHVNDCLPRPEAYRMCDAALQRQQARCDDQLAALRSTMALRARDCPCPEAP